MADARAPYNFVPLAEGEPIPGERVAHDRYHLDRHTGYFDVRLETVTPLFVRGMVTDQQLQDGMEAKDLPNPFIVDGKPVIPGSSLRGMIRNLVEIITFGKMHFVSDNKLVYRAIYYADALATTYRGIITDVQGSKEFMYPSTRMYGGYLQKGDSESGWVIQPANAPYGESIALVDRQDVLDAGISETPKLKVYKVGVKPATKRLVHTGKQGVQLHVAQAHGISLRPGSGYEPAALIISNTVGQIGGKGSNRRWYPAIFEPNPTVDPILISQAVWNDFIKDREVNRGIANRTIQNPGDVLFYLLDHQGELLFFGPTMFFRVPYENSIGTLIYDEHPDRNFIDFADGMFGYVSDRGNTRDPNAYAGRISVTSARLVDNQTDVFYGENEELRRTPGSPKPTTFQHYLCQPLGKVTPKRDLHHYGSKGARIRGQKLYWRQRVDIHHLKNGNSDGTKPKIETKFRPVREGKTFSFRVYFENMSNAELGALQWALTLGGDENHYHMLGMGKPYGLGVVKLTPTLVISDREARYCRAFNSDGSWHQPHKLSSDYTEAFKGFISTQGIDFDNAPRIRALKAMLRLYDPDPEFFSYMQIERMIEGERVNEYRDRPVLPEPEEIADEYFRKRRELERLDLERRIAGNILIKESLALEDVIRGEVFASGEDIWFIPTEVLILNRWVNLSELNIEIPYEAEIPPSYVQKRRTEGARVVGRIVNIKGGNPIHIICEQIIRS